MFIRKSLLSAGLTLTMVSAQAADPWSLSHVTLNELKQTIHVDASPTVRHIRPSTQSALSWLAQHTDERGVEHVRLQQYYLGFPVWGGYAILHRQSEIQTINSETFRTRLNGVIFRDLDADLGQPPHDFTFRGNMALEHMKARYATKTVHEAEIKPLIYVDEQQKPHWAYQVSFFIHRSDHIPMRPTAIVDAVTFEPFIEWNEVKTLKTPVKGLGFGGNAGGKQVQYGQDKPFLLLTRDSVKQLCSLENQHVSVRDMASDIHGPGEMFTFDCKTPADAYWTGSDKDGYDRVNEAYSPSNDALYIGTLVHDTCALWQRI